MSINFVSKIQLWVMVRNEIYSMIIFIPLILFIQCSGENRIDKEVKLISSIYLDDDFKDTIEIDLFSIAKNVSVILLEKTSESIVGNIYDIAFGEGFIFLGTENDYFIFTDKGRFIKKPFKTGRGPKEVNNPIFCTLISDNKIWFNESNKRHFISSYDILSENWEAYEIPTWVNVNKIVVDSDTSIAYISRSMSTYNRKVTFNFTFIRQKLSSEILDSISFGIGTSEFLSFCLVKDIDGGIFAMNPRGDSLTYIKNGYSEVLWRNNFKLRRNNISERKEIKGASLLYYSADSLWLSRNTKIIGNIIRSGLSDLFFVDRVSGKSVVVNLFLKNHSYKIYPNRIFILGDNKFCIMLSSYETLSNCNNKEDFDLLFYNQKVSIDDNPILIMGEFR